MLAGLNRHFPRTALAVLALIPSFTPAQDLHLDAVDPATGSPTAATPVTLSGAHFAEDLRAALVDGGIVDLGLEPSVSQLDHDGSLFFGADVQDLVLMRLDAEGRLVETGRLALGGEITALDLDGDLAVAAVFDWEQWRTWLTIIDVTDPGQPAALGSLDLSSNAYLITLAVEGTTAVWSEFNGYHFVDLMEPAHPIERSVVSTRPGFTDFAMAGGFLYGGEISTGLLVIDYHDLDVPEIVYSSREYRPWRKMQVSGERLYFYSYPQGLMIVDVTDPASPVTVGHFAASVARFDVQGERLVAQFGLRTALFDVSDPANLVEIDAVGTATDRPDTLLLQGPWIVEGLYSIRHRFDAHRTSRPAPLFHFQDRSTSREAMTVSDEWLYIGRKDGLEVWKLEGGEDPQRVGTIETGDAYSDLLVHGDYLYALSWSSPGLTIFDLTIPESPTVAARVGGLTGARLEARDQWLYVVQSRALLIVDASDPLQPAEVGRIPAQSRWGNYVLFDDVCIDGSDAYIVSSTNSLFLADVSNPESAHIVWETPDIFGLYPRRCTIDGDHLYVSTQRTVAVLDKGDWSVRGQLRPVHAPSELRAVDGQLYVSDMLGLKIFDTSVDPLRPSLRVATDHPGSPQIGAIAIDASRALTVGWYDLAVVRTNPVLEQQRWVSESRVEFTVPPGMNAGTYHVLAEQPGSAVAYLGNAFEVVETCLLEANLSSDLDPLSGRLSLPGRWVLEASGDQRFFDPTPRHRAWLELPPVGSDPIVERFPADGPEEVIELHFGPETAVLVKLIGPDPESLEQRWASIAEQGGIPLEADGPTRYQPLTLNLRREQASARLAIDPAGSPLAAEGSTVYRYTWREGVLVSATARGTEVDHRFHLAGKTADGCEAEDVVSVFDQAAAACQTFDADNPSWKIDCPVPF